ncbi:MAG TPA: hypothetical protein VHW09_26800 [Bryobacteraceae bacterium]|jgi:hypothetical protein|nr:hypothetical protein [Bryobacteraceae bacterium]
MSQNSLTLPTSGTVSGLQMAQATNNALDTLNTLASGASAPGSPEAGQLWHDTTNNLLKIRSLDNTTWVPFLQLNESSYAAAPSNSATGANDRLNRLINGAMMIDQVNEGASYSVPVNNTLTYAVDQWIAACLSTGSASGVTAQRVADAPAGFVNSLKVTVGTGAGSVGAGDFLLLSQPIEANNLGDINFGTANAVPLSLSFWVKSSVAGTFAAALQNAAGSRVLVHKFSIVSTGTWTQITIPNIVGDTGGTWVTSGNAVSMTLFITVATGSTYQQATLDSWVGGTAFGSTSQTNGVLTTTGATFQVAGVQLNSGSFCMPFEKRQFQQELSLCQRYFEKSYDFGTAVGTASSPNGCEYFVAAAAVDGAGIRYKVTKRADPSLTLYSPNSGTSGKAYDSNGSADVTVGGANIGQNGAIGAGSGFTSGHQIQQHWTASARM